MQDNQYNLNPTELCIFNLLKHVKATKAQVQQMCNKTHNDNIISTSLDSLNQRGFVNKDTNSTQALWYVSEHWLD